MTEEYEEYVSNGSAKCSAGKAAGVATIGAIGLVNLASFAAGAYAGFCDAQGIPISKENVYSALAYGPMIVQGAGLGLIGLVAGGRLGLTAASEPSDGCLEAILKFTVLPPLCTVAGGVVGGFLGTSIAVIEELVGYGAGYLVGHIGK
ncbi:MAG: hypothetical protein NTZ02_01720 [Candidatus Woesearchaeota archaeon]|nr:hypothetical protein [Candidatus Woesearchaeota archaeon]